MWSARVASSGCLERREPLDPARACTADPRPAKTAMDDRGAVEYRGWLGLARRAYPGAPSPDDVAVRA